MQEELETEKNCSICNGNGKYKMHKDNGLCCGYGDYDCRNEEYCECAYGVRLEAEERERLKRDIDWDKFEKRYKIVNDSLPKRLLKLALCITIAYYIGHICYDYLKDGREMKEVNKLEKEVQRK